MQSWRFDEVATIERTERSDGSGDLTLAHRSQRSDSEQGGPLGLSLVGISDVRTVEKLVRAQIDRIGS